MKDRPRWYHVVYRLAYRLGLTIWQRPAPPPDLVALVEGPVALPPGRALDVGCGTGIDAVYLATHGWDVTAVDIVPKALTAARARAIAAGVSARFIEGDITHADALDLGEGYTLLLDFGCFHTLPDDQRPVYIAAITRAAAPEATLLLYGFTHPPKAAPMHAAISAEEVRHRFGPAGWDLCAAERASAEGLGVGVRNADDRFALWRFHLHRQPA